MGTTIFRIVTTLMLFFGVLGLHSISRQLALIGNNGLAMEIHSIQHGDCYGD